MADSSQRLKTWSALASRRRRPSEYEVVTYKLHTRTRDPETAYELDPNIFANRWYRQYVTESPLQHDDWDAFRDPDEVIYRTYTLMQDGQEAYVEGLVDNHSHNEHDGKHSERWLDSLARLYTPGRYLQHTVQMASAYLAQMAPASTITNCAVFQQADAFRWLSWTAYRTRELGTAHPTKGFGEERARWEDDPAWQGFRELMERVLVAYDWGEHFVALNLVAKPIIDEVCVRQLGASARHHEDTLLAMMADAQFRDVERSRRWTATLTEFALQREENREVIAGWIEKWVPLSAAAAAAYCGALPDAPGAAARATAAAAAFRAGLGFAM